MGVPAIGNVGHGENWSKWSASSAHWTDYGCMDLWALESWRGVTCWGIHSRLHVRKNASLTEHTGPVLWLAVAERNQGRSLTKSAWLTRERKSLNLVSTCLAILAHCSSWFQANCHSSWSLVWITACNHLKATLKLNASSVCETLSLREWKGVVGTDSSIRGTSNGPPLSSLTQPSRGMGWPLAYFPPLTAGQLGWKCKAVTCIGAAG